MREARPLELDPRPNVELLAGTVRINDGIDPELDDPAPEEVDVRRGRDLEGAQLVPVITAMAQDWRTPEGGEIMPPERSS